MAELRGGDKFEAAMAALASKIDKKATLRVGWLENATYPNGTKVAMVAAIQEYGAPKVGIPPRPFFRTMISDKQGEWPSAIAETLRANEMDVDRSLEVVGAAVAGQLRESIIKMNSPPLSQITLMIRKMKSEGATITRKSLKIAAGRLAAGESVAGIPTKPLVGWPDGGHMLNSIDHEVKT